MPGRPPLSFHRRLLWALLGVGGAAVVLLGTLLIAFHFASGRQQAEASLESQLRVVAIHSQAALSFGDATTGRETLTALRAAPAVVWAALYDAEGDLFAVYDPRELTLAPPRLASLAARTGGAGGLVLTQPVTHEGSSLGTVAAAYDMDAVYQRLWRDIALSVVVSLVVLLGATLLALQLRRLLAKPLRELVDTARRVSERDDYTARARKHTQDEFGGLTDTFNTMLDRIQSQQVQLRQRNEEMQQLLYTVSHDLKSPLVSITGFAGLAREDVAQRQYDQLEDSLEHLTRAAQHMGKLIDDLLELSRIGRVRHSPRRIDTTRLVRDVIEGLRPRLGPAGATVDLQHDLPAVYADPVRLRQVFENLLTNAVKYGLGGDGGVAVIQVGGSRSGEEARFYVRDHGPGVDPEHRERIFTLFQRLHKSAEGTGIGLTIAAKILEVNGGRIWFEPTPGGGATFWFSLPAPSGNPPAASAEGA